MSGQPFNQQPGYPQGISHPTPNLSAPQPTFTNDSFQMSTTPILATTRPYDNTTAAIEKFLTTGVSGGNAKGKAPATVHTSVPGASATTATPPLQTSAYSSFAAPPVPSWQQKATALHPAPPSLASTSQPFDARSNGFSGAGSPLMLSPTGGSPRYAQAAPGLTSSTKPSTSVAPVLTSFQRHTGRSPTSPQPTLGFPAMHSGTGRGAPVAPNPHTGSVGGQTRASDDSLRRTPHGSPQPLPLARSRSNRELTSLFASERNSGDQTSPAGAGRVPNSNNGGRASPSILQSMHSGGGYNPSAGPHTSSRQSGSMTGPKPQWLNAVERMRRADATHQPVLPLDQSKLGMAAHRAQQQGMLTAAQLRSHEEQVAAGYGRPRSPQLYPQEPQRLQPLYASGFSPVERRSPSGRSASPTAPLRAQEMTLQGSDSRSNALGSDGSTWRKGRVRSVAATPSRAAVSTGGRVSAGGRVSPHGGGNTPIGNSRMFDPTALSYSAMNADPFLGSRGGQGSGNLGRKAPPPPTLFASEVHEAVAGSPTKAADGKGADKTGSKPKSTKGGRTTTRRARGGGGGGGSDREAPGASDGGSEDSDPSGNGTRAGGKVTANNRSNKKDHLEEDERDEQMLRSRDYNALHAIPWEQRRTMPMTGFGTRLFAVLASPRIWEKLDWTLRGAVLTILPTMVLSLEPATAPKFPMASNLAFTAFWITMPTFGAGLRELFIAIKGFCMGLVFVLITIAIDPPDWGVILCLFFFTLICAFVAEQSRKTIAYVLCSSLMQLISDRVNTNYKYVGIYYEAIFVALSFGTAAFLVPFIRWSSRAAKHYLKALGNALSIEVQGMLSSFWVRNALERELNVVRLRQLRHTAEECMKKISVAIAETGYEPHSGKFVGMLKNRFQFCQSIHNVLGSLNQVIELLCDNPELTDTPMCNTFGAQICDDLAVIASAMDTMILKIVDFSRPVTVEEIFFFQQARERFQEALSKVREDVILNNEDYETDDSDVFLGFFMFSIDELCETIASFQEEAEPRNNITFWLTFWIRDIKSSLAAFRSLCLTLYYNRSITRRLKEAIKLSLCMALPVIFQVYALKNQPTSPMAGASIIAFMYNPTGSESFHYCSGRLLGTVLGSTASLLSVQIANGRRGVLYVFIALLSIIACYVQAAPGFYSLGNAMACSTISITTQYKDLTAAMLRIQQNCFAILIYFFIISLIWPMRGRTKVKMGLDVSLRCLRESSARLLCNLDMPYDAEEVATDVQALLIEMRKKIGTQDNFIPGAVEEPTLSSAEFPADAWKRIVEAEKSIHSTLAMMRFAYREFMSSRADANTELSVHWVVLHRIAPHAKDLSDLIYATIDLHLLSLSKTTVVPTSQLTRLRRGMIDSQKEIMHTYIETISHKIAGDDSDDGAPYDDDDDEGEYYDDDNGDGGSYDSSLPAPPLEQRHDGDGDDANGDPDGGDGRGKPTKAKTSDHGGSAGHDHDSDDDDGSDGSSHTHGSGDEGHRRQKKKAKKTGYLGYKLTPEEAKALKEFINNGRVPGVTDASFSPAGTIATNASFSPASFGTKRSAVSNASMVHVPPALMETMTDNPGWKTGALAQHGNNDGRMMALAGNDDSMAARLRKKHHLNKKTDDGDDKADGADGEDLTLTNNKSFGNNNASFGANASFFLKNTSFLGKMFRRKKTDYQHDLDDDDDDHHNKDDDEVTGSPAQRQLTEAMSRASSQHSSPPRRRHGGRDGKANASSSTLTAVDAFSPASARTRSQRGDMTDEDDPLGHSRHGEQDNLLLSSSVKEESGGVTKANSGAAASDTEMPEILNESALKVESQEPVEVPVTTSAGPPEASIMGSSPISTTTASAGLKKTTATMEEEATMVTPKRDQTAASAAKDVDDDGHAVKSSNSSGGGTGSTEKKVLSGNERTSTTKSSPDRDLDQAKKQPTTTTIDLAQVTKQSTINSLLPGQLLQSSLGAGGGDSQGPPNGALGDISFFDPESGEFILTNHDIHSLEAFLFGTRALVVYLNDLQKSILEMQHSTELAKKL